MTSKQRAYLKSLAMKLDPILNVGKESMTPGLTEAVNEALEANELIKVGVLLFAAVLAFHLITLPVEFNASSRGLKVLENSGILQGEENTYAKKVLGAAALTYVASAAAMSLQLLRLLILTRGYRNND